MGIEIKEVRAYVYECYTKSCSHREEVQRSNARDGKCCSLCGESMRIVEGITTDNKTFYIARNNEQFDKFVESSQERIEAMRQHEQEREERHKHREIARLEDEVITLRDGAARYQERIVQLQETSNKALGLFDTLRETKPAAKQTIEAMADTIINSDREAAGLFTSFMDNKIKIVKLLLEIDKLRDEVNN